MDAKAESELGTEGTGTLSLFHFVNRDEGPVPLSLIYQLQEIFFCNAAEIVGDVDVT